MSYINKYDSCNYGYNISSDIQHMSEKWINKLKILRKTNIKYIQQFEDCKNKAVKSNKIKINEYDLNGKYIKTWNSIKEASDFYNYKCSSLIFAVLNFKKSKAKNSLFRYYIGNTNNIEPFKSFRKTKIRFISNTEKLIFNSGIEASIYFKTSRSNISISIKNKKYKNYIVEKI